jgi:hypothetical protein
MKTLTKLALSSLLAGMISQGVAIAGDQKKMTVFKTPWCGCCKTWTSAMEKAGYKVIVQDMDDLSAIRRQAGVPESFEGCHTAVLGKYVLEGHVPLQAINKLLEEQPKIRGLTVPGMPAGSLGMGYDAEAKYDVLAFTLSKTDKPVVYFQAGQ